MQQPLIVRNTKSMVPSLLLAMLYVIHQQEGFIEKHLLCLRWQDIVFINDLLNVAGIPVKTFSLLN